MNLLLDTHVVLWWLDDPELLDRQARGAIADNRTNVYVSAVSIWEIVLKKSIGKLQLPDEDIRDVIEQCRFQTLPLSADHACTLERLPSVHRDPFDRMIIAQALFEKMTLVTRDRKILSYDLIAKLPA